ncbi:hypothetical protein [Empedobacter brevis]|uniref:hypothetical protein n=1 Tax=Empedobacter brevis TaxID=247 RepID=UPI00333EDA11
MGKLIFLVLSITLFSCSNDDNSNVNPYVDNINIIGTWVKYPNKYADYESLEFKQDGTYTLIENIISYPNNPPLKGTFKYKQNVLTLRRVQNFEGKDIIFENSTELNIEKDTIYFYKYHYTKVK